MRSLILIASAVVVLSGNMQAVGQDSPVAPKLEDIDRRTTPPAPSDDAAKPLPATVTICQDNEAQRCWTESGTTDCGDEATPGAKVFRRVISNGNPGAALTECWSTVAH